LEPLLVFDDLISEGDEIRAVQGAEGEEATLLSVLRIVLMEEVQN
jgi:hypothetical protein